MFSSADHDDEFVSEAYQASTSDIAEAEQIIKNLGVGGNYDLINFDVKDYKT